MKNFKRLLREAYRRGYRCALNETRKGYKDNAFSHDPGWLTCFEYNVLEYYMSQAQRDIKKQMGKEGTPELDMDYSDQYENMNNRLFGLLQNYGRKSRNEILRDLYEKGVKGVFYQVAENFLSGDYFGFSDIIHDKLATHEGNILDVIDDIRDECGRNPSVEDIENSQFFETFCGTIKYCIEFTIEAALQYDAERSTQYHVRQLGDDEVYNTLRSGVFSGLFA